MVFYKNIVVENSNFLKIVLFRFWIFILAELFAISTISGQSKQITFDYITADDGLSGNYVSCVFRDSKDYLWIGTNEQGVNKYNGYSFKLYNQNEALKGSLSHNNVFTVFEDQKNNIWIGTAGGLNLYDPKIDSFTVYKHNSADTTSLGSDRVYNLFEDHSNNLWIVCGDNGGLSKWNPDNNSFERYMIPGDIGGLKGYENRNSLTDVAVDSKGIFWIVNSGPDLYSFDPKKGEFQIFRNKKWNLKGASYKIIVIDNEDKLWMTSHRDGFYSFDPLTNEFRSFGKEIGLKGSPDKILSDVIIEDNSHILIAANQGGISRFDKTTETFENISCETCNIPGLNSLGVRSLYIDKENIFWVGTTRGGVNYFNPKRQKFKLMSHNSDYADGKLRNLIGWIYEDSKGLIWIATDGGGIDVYDSNLSLIKNYSHDPLDPNSLSGNVVRCIEEDKNGYLWIGTWDAGLNKLDPNTGKFKRFTSGNEENSLSTNTVWNFKIDKNENIWISNLLGGVEIFHRDLRVIKKYKANPDQPGALNNANILHIYEDREENMWICTKEGIHLYDWKSETFKLLADLPSNDIKVLCRDNNGDLWAGSTSDGLFQIDISGNLLNTYNEKNGLSNNSIVSIVEDDNGHMWIATKKGLNVIIPATNEIRKYYEDDGLQGDVFFALSAMKSRNGLLFFGGYEGFNYFYPDSVKINEFVPNVYITDFKIFNKSVSHGSENSILKHHISETNEVSFQSNLSFFSFEFAAINYTNPEKTNYAYMLEGFDTEWNYIGTKRDATYTNLTPGKYKFRVKASNNDGVWNEEGTQINVNVLPMYWQTWLFRIGLLLFVLGIAFVFYYQRLTRIRKNQSDLTHLVRERTQELEQRQKVVEGQTEKLRDQNLQLQNQKQELNKVISELQQTQSQLIQSEKMASLGVLTAGVAHEINNPLNFIQTGLYAIDTVKDEENINSESLNLILEKIGEGVNRASLIVQSLNSFSRRSAETFSLCDLHKILDNSLLILEHELKYKCHIQKNYCEEHIYVKGFEENLHQVFINIILNAVQSFEETGSIEISTYQTKDKAHISIKDNGSGIPPEMIHQIFDPFFTTKDPGKGVGLGLSIVYKIITEHNGTIEYQSEQNHGTEVNIQLPKQLS